MTLPPIEIKWILIVDLYFCCHSKLAGPGTFEGWIGGEISVWRNHGLYLQNIRQIKPFLIQTNSK